MEVAGPTLPIKDNCHLPQFLHARPDSVFCFEIADAGGGGTSESSSSSIGAQSSSSSSSDEDEDEVQSGALGCLDSLEDALPIKRGLSNFFTGKSRSFQSLSEVSTVEVVAKPENPFNKRRRILIASRSKRAKSYGSLLPPLPPLAASDGEDEDEDEDDDEDEDRGGGSGGRPPLFPGGGGRSKDDDRVVKKEFKSNRSFSLTDLQHV